MMINDKELWLSQYAKTFYDLYWEGPKRVILDRARKLEGDDCYILHIVAEVSKKHSYHFITYEMAMADADKFPDVPITVGDSTFQGLRQVLMLSKECHEAATSKSKKFVLALFNASNKDGTVLYTMPSIWCD